MKYIRQVVLDNPLLTGSFLMLVGSNMANAIAYIYHPILGRLLGKVAYGELAAFLSLAGFLASLYSFLGLLIMKYAAKDTTREKSLEHFFSLLKIFEKPTLLITGVIILLTPLLSTRLQISVPTYVLLGPIFFMSFRIFFFKSFLQGRLMFGKISLYSILEMLGRLAFGAILVLLGFGVTGAVIGFLLSLLPEWILLRRDIWLKKASSYTFEIKQLIQDGLPVLVSSLATTAFFSMDVLLVRTFFSAADSGTYAAATLGKIILFATLPITAVLFPLISKKHASGESGSFMFLLSFMITFCFGGMFALLFYFMPQLVVIPFGSGFQSSIPLLFPYGMFMFLFVLDLVIINYYLPREQYYPIKSLAVAAVVQTIGIILFHETLATVINVSIIVALVLLGNLLIYFVYEDQAVRKVLSKAFSHNPRLQG